MYVVAAVGPCGCSRARDGSARHWQIAADPRGCIMDPVDPHVAKVSKWIINSGLLLAIGTLRPVFGDASHALCQLASSHWSCWMDHNVQTLSFMRRPRLVLADAP